MTDYDRGAYTPQTDAPLAFDPRRPSERRPMPMALIGSGVVLAVLLAGVAMVYRGGVRHAGESPRPVGEPVMAVKTAPPLASQTAANEPAAPSSMDVYNAGEANTVGPASNTVASAPSFTPPAEQPVARPAPSPATVAMLSKPSAPTHIERRPTPTETAAAPAQPLAKVAAAPAKKAPPVVAKVAMTKTVSAKAIDTSVTPAAETKTASLTAPRRPVLRSKLDESELAAAGATRTEAGDADTDASTATKLVVHKAKPAKLAAADPIGALVTSSTAVAAAPAGKSVVQIGAFSSSALADKGYADVSATLPAKMGGKAKHVQSLDKDGTTLYRTWLSGFATRADAQAFCEALKAKGKTCLVKG